MKKFNQMTEKQMSKTEGGLLAIIMTAFSCFTAAASISGTIATTVQNKK